MSGEGGELVPAEDRVLAELDFETPLVLDRHDALHFYFAVTHTLFQLNLKTDDIGMGQHRFAKSEWIAEAMQNAGDDAEKKGEILDELGEFALECSDALANFLLARGIGGAHFFVWMPCHGRPAQYWPRNDQGKPEVITW